MMYNSQYLIDLTLEHNRIPSYDEFPYNLAVVRNLTTLKLHPKVTYFIGENGSGKSTLLEAIAVALGFNAEGGTKNFSFETRDERQDLSRALWVSKSHLQPRDGFFLRAESFFNVATQIDELDLKGWYGGKSLHEQSHGESFLTLMTTRFRGDGIYILDEPEAALSPQRQLAILSRIHDLVRDSSQFIIATHSPILMAYPDSTIYECTSEGIKETTYEDTEHYQVTRDFLVNRERMLKILLEDM